VNLEGLFQSLPTIILVVVGVIVVSVLGIIYAMSKCYKKVAQGMVVVRNGIGGPKVSFGGVWVWPIIHRFEEMDISLKRIETNRQGEAGLVCQDNIRADIKVAFFVRVNQTKEDVLKVAQSLGCALASDQKTLETFFDAKFSEALKTVGKKFDFVQLYTERKKFKEEILQVLGTDLNGYILDDAAIDYLEQTALEHLNNNNILDVEGIKKITEITAREVIKANQIQRDKEKTIEKQNVEAKEAILALQRQQAEAEEKQKREISTIKSREEAEAAKVYQEEKLKSERARIATEEEVAVAEENKNRQIVVAQKAKERTSLVETERVDKDRLLEKTEKDKIVSLAEIAKERVVEEERKNIQSVIRDRVAVEKEVVAEQERIKDTQAFAEAERAKKVAITHAEKTAQEMQTKEIATAEASKKAAIHLCEQEVFEADAKMRAAEKDSEARKMLAEAKAAEEAAPGMSQVKVMEARAKAIEVEGAAKAKVLEMTAQAEAKGIELKSNAIEVQGTADASVMTKRFTAEAQGIELKASAEAKGVEAKAVALEKQGTTEASVMLKKFNAEAEGIREKANAMKGFDGSGREHEEFKLQLEKERTVELAGIEIQKDIASSQAAVIQEALRASKIEIFGGETLFFDKIMGSITSGKAVDKMVDNSNVLTDVRKTFINGDPEYFKSQLKNFISQFNLKSEDIKNLTVSALVTKMLASSDDDSKGILQNLLGTIEKLGIGNKPAIKFLA
jgi:uncharacterized membrane protein YqiK